MIKRTIDISHPSYLHLKHQQLVIERKRTTIATVSIEDVGVLILEHPAIVMTQALIIACQQHNIAVVFCDQQHLPYSALLPISDGHNLHTQVIQQQIEASAPTKKRLWQQIVKYKLQEQAKTLAQLNCDNDALIKLAGKVKSGDVGNLEAQGAQKYWPILMGQQFRRNPELPDTNSLLNYGYAAIRAMVARALCGTGLHPALGIHHKNQYNGLCLADDVMEPFRPWVDYLVCRLATEKKETTVTPSSKRILLSILAAEVQYRKKKMPLMVACHYLCADIKQALVENKPQIDYPLWQRKLSL